MSASDAIISEFINLCPIDEAFLRRPSNRETAAYVYVLYCTLAAAELEGSAEEVKKLIFGGNIELDISSILEHYGLSDEPLTSFPAAGVISEFFKQNAPAATYNQYRGEGKNYILPTLPRVGDGWSGVLDLAKEKIKENMSEPKKRPKAATSTSRKKVSVGLPPRATRANPAPLPPIHVDIDDDSEMPYIPETGVSGPPEQLLRPILTKTEEQKSSYDKVTEFVQLHSKNPTSLTRIFDSACVAEWVAASPLLGEFLGERNVDKKIKIMERICNTKAMDLITESENFEQSSRVTMKEEITQAVLKGLETKLGKTPDVLVEIQSLKESINQIKHNTISDRPSPFSSGLCSPRETPPPPSGQDAAMAFLNRIQSRNKK